jgi:hypothetical protein
MQEKKSTTVKLRKSTVKELKSIRKYPRETYNGIIFDLIKIGKDHRRKRQYDEFLCTIQQAKMKELWDNEEDETWESA